MNETDYEISLVDNEDKFNEWCDKASLVVTKHTVFTWLNFETI